jgi:hypothetical protein
VVRVPQVVRSAAGILCSAVSGQGDRRQEDWQRAFHPAKTSPGQHLCTPGARTSGVRQRSLPGIGTFMAFPFRSKLEPWGRQSNWSGFVAFTEQVMPFGTGRVIEPVVLL